VNWPTGWIDDPRECERIVSSLERPLFALASPETRGTGEGKTVFLHQAMRKVFGYDPVHKQTIGDCVSHGWGLGTDALACVEEIWHGEGHQVFETATEPVYAHSRVEIGGGRLGSSDGSIGGWAAKSVRQGGTLVRKKYARAGQSVDYTTYSGRKAREMGRPRVGVPDWIEPTMAEHRVQQTSLVTSWEEYRDAIANGYPIPICSNQGFSSRRDNQGFARPEGSWAHCMLGSGLVDDARRPGGLIQNSWGEWNGGPTGEHDIPPGSFLVDADVLDRMLRRQDSYAMSSYQNYPRRDMEVWLAGWGEP